MGPRKGRERGVREARGVLGGEEGGAIVKGKRSPKRDPRGGKIKKKKKPRGGLGEKKKTGQTPGSRGRRGGKV